MSSSADRFRQRKAVAPAVRPAGELSIDGQGKADLLASVHLSLDVATVQIAPDALLTEIHGALDAEKIASLIEACRRECLEAVVRPFLVGRVLFADKDGGNVDTVHNARQDVYATEQERQRYEDRGEYDSAAHHGDSRYIEANKAMKAQQEAGELRDTYSDREIGNGQKKNLDHVKSAKENHDDQGRVLAELDSPDLANLPENLRETTETLNKSKKAKTAGEFAEYVQTKIPALESEIAALEAKPSLTPKEAAHLDAIKNKLTEFENLDTEKLMAADKAAREAIDHKINRAYYTSGKFLKNTLKTSAVEGGKMALQQALGLLMEEFVRAAFDEVADAWKNGFKSEVDDSFLDALKARLTRVAQRVLARWKDAAFALRDGFMSGVLSNLVTVLINVFATTKARIVRMLREGAMSLYKAVKLLASPPEGTSLAEAGDAALKILAAALVTTCGVMLEEVLDTHLRPLGPLAPYVSTIAVGLITGLGSTFTVHMLDHLDFFGVQGGARHDAVMAQLDQWGTSSYERALESASTFAPLQLPHLA